MATAKFSWNAGGKLSNIGGANPYAPAPKRLTVSGAAPQAKLRGPDKWGFTTYRCSRHENMDYRIKDGQVPVCPLCEEKGRTELLRKEMQKLSGANDILKRDLSVAKAQLTSLDGMREAASELGDVDAMFLKELIYRYRDNPKSVRVSQKVAKRTVRVEGVGTAVRHEVVGFRIEYRDSDEPQFVDHEVSSIGGKMIALQFSEALKVTGLKGAMESLMKALHQTMASPSDE